MSLPIGKSAVFFARYAGFLCKEEKSAAKGQPVLVYSTKTWYSVFIQVQLYAAYTQADEEDGMEKRFLLVEAGVLPQVFLRVVEAKELLASGGAKNISEAAKQVGLSRSAFYKYKDSIFDAQDGRDVLTVNATLRDETGALQNLLAGISAAGASIVTINQATPENGAAQVAVSIRTGGMQGTLEDMLSQLRRQPAVVELHRGV